MREITENKDKQKPSLWMALILSIVTFLIPFAASIVLALRTGSYGVLPPCRFCDDPNTGGQFFIGILILWTWGPGIVLMLLFGFSSLILLLAESKKRVNNLFIATKAISIINVFVFLLFLFPGSPFFHFANFITTSIWGGKCYGSGV